MRLRTKFVLVGAVLVALPLTIGGVVVDVVLMDVQMPEMGGFEATAAIRERERGTGRHMPIVALTARAMTGDRERCLSAGMDEYVAKPVQANELFAAIDRVMASHSSLVVDRLVQRATNDQEPTTNSSTLDSQPANGCEFTIGAAPAEY